jgi:uncharacterized protein (DUF433 family)
MAATEIAPGIVIDESVRSGKPVIKGTRVSVEVVVGHLAAGDSAGQICAEYGISEADIRAALAYAASRLGDETIRAIG